MSSLMMRLIASVLALTMVIQVAKAQNTTQVVAALEGMPVCGLSCMTMYIPRSPCAITDQHCLCTNEDLTAGLTACIQANCTLPDVLTTVNSVSQICEWPVHDRRPVIRGVTISFFVVASLCYFARMTARMPFFGGELGPDDYTISISYLFTIGCTVIQLLLTHYGIGRDIWVVPHSPTNDMLTPSLKTTLAYEECYLVATWFAKISVLCLYLRIFQDAKLRIRVYSSIVFCAVVLVALFLPNIFHCRPISYAWTFWDGKHQGWCSSDTAPFWASAILNIFGDLLVVCLPLPTIWNMSLPKGKRVGVMVMFSAGVIITVVSAARLSTIHVFGNSDNQTYDYVNAILYTIVEVDVTVMCACLPGVRNFYHRVVCGRIVGTGKFATNTSRSHSPASVRRPTSKASDLTHSQISETSTLKTITTSEEVMFVLKDVDIEEYAGGPRYPARAWSYGSHVEEWPVRLEQ